MFLDENNIRDYIGKIILLEFKEARSNEANLVPAFIDNLIFEDPDKYEISFLSSYDQYFTFEKIILNSSLNHHIFLSSHFESRLMQIPTVDQLIAIQNNYSNFYFGPSIDQIKEHKAYHYLFYGAKYDILERHKKI